VPRRRKGLEHYCPSIPVLLRDARPTKAEITDEPDPSKRRDTQRAYELAVDQLTKMYRSARKSGKLDRLDPRVRNFCELLKDRNQGRLPKPKGGRPTAEHRRLSMAIEVKTAIGARGKKRGSVEQALREVSERFGVSYDHLRDIHYDRDPEWRSTVKAELSRRKFEAEG
jgi:hypothetical protein